MPRWTPDQRWTDRDVYILGGGPSLTGFDFDRLLGQNTIGCNGAFRLGKDRCNLCIFSDVPFFENNHEELSLFHGDVVTHNPDLASAEESWLKYVPREDAGVHRDRIGYNTCSGAAAITLALMMGAKRVMLLGFDCKPGKEHSVKPNWYQTRCEVPSVEVFPKFEEGFRTVAQQYRSVFPNTEIINLGPDSVLTCFKRRAPELFI